LDKVTEKTENDIMTNTTKDKLKDDATKIVRPWEELQLKRNRYGLGYEKDVDNLFHIPNYCTPITFVSGGFLDDDKEQVSMLNRYMMLLQLEMIKMMMTMQMLMQLRMIMMLM
jgi:hypothetical protein